LKLLIDENLSPCLARWACESGVPAEAVAHVGLSGATDAAVFATAFSQDQVVVTVNVGDFITLAAGVDLHPGVIALREAELSAALQWERLNTALAFAEKTCNGDLINRVLEVQEEGECMLHAIPAEHTN
jgi:predicted nuclease of predicted toxin-antitoxin system